MVIKAPEYGGDVDHWIEVLRDESRNRHDRGDPLYITDTGNTDNRSNHSIL